MARWDQDRAPGRRVVPEECPVALVYEGTTVAVVMATPNDLADLAIGFSLTEGIVSDASEITELDIVSGCDGIELRMWLAPGRAETFRARQRRLVGPTGCGLCGIESLAEAVRSNPKVARHLALTPVDVREAVEQLAAAQALNQVTRATHAAGFHVPARGLLACREMSAVITRSTSWQARWRVGSFAGVKGRSC